jgi:hypothetical protein
MGESVLADWSAAAKLSPNTVETLEAGECTEEDTLCLLTGEDVAMLDVSLGQRKRLIAALATLCGKQADGQPGVAKQPIGLLPTVDAVQAGDPTQ